MSVAFKSQPQYAFADAHSAICKLRVKCTCLASEFALLPSGAYKLDEDDAQEATVFLRGETWSFMARDRRYPRSLPIIDYGFPSIGSAVEGALDALDQIRAEAVRR